MTPSQRTAGYLASLQKPQDTIIQKMETYADLHNIPIMDRNSIDALLTLLKLRKPKKVLEIGTAIGYSAIRMAQTLPGSLVVSIDRDSERLATAKSFIAEAGLSERIHLLQGEATEQSEKLKTQQPFGALLIDAAKGQYQHFFDIYSPFIEPGGIIVSDNILFRGLVAANSLPPRRFRSTVNKLRDYNQYLAEHSDFDTTFLPIGDGLAVSIKNE